MHDDTRGVDDRPQARRAFRQGRDSMLGDVRRLDRAVACLLLRLGHNGFDQCAPKHPGRFGQSRIGEQDAGSGPVRTRVVHKAIMAGVLISVGHGALDRTGLVHLLRAADIEALVDIRRFPNSRHNPDVERTAITAWAQDAGLAYRWDARLGGRRRLPAGSDPEDTWWRVQQFAAYAADTRTAPFSEALSELVEQSKRQRTAMMCSEALWWRWHRRIVADVAVLLFSVDVCHLMHDGRRVAHTPSEGARLRPDGQIEWKA